MYVTVHVLAMYVACTCIARTSTAPLSGADKSLGHVNSDLSLSLSLPLSHTHTHTPKKKTFPPPSFIGIVWL
jgi:hypothetical protein